MAAGERELEPLQKFGRPLADVVGPHPYLAWQQAFDPLLTPGAGNYWKSHNLVNPLSSGLLDKLVEFGRRLPSPQCEVVPRTDWRRHAPGGGRRDGVWPPGY